MPVYFATPIAHQIGADYTAFNNAIAVGRPFRQPLLTAPTPADFSRGRELFLSPAGVVPDLFAWLDGTLTWTAATEDEPGARLVLTTDPLVLAAPGAARTLASVPMLERRPKKAIYENVDAAAVQAALEAILNAAYTAAVAAPNAPRTWHPSMRMEVPSDGNSVSLKAYLDGHAPAAATITQLVTGFVTGAVDVVLTQLRVKAGERIGQAAPFLATDPLPAAPSFALGAAADANRARRLTFVAEDTNGQVLDPLYYFHVLMRRMLLAPASRIVTTLTNTVVAGALTHPLVTLYPALGNAAVPKARIEVDGAYRYPLGDLVDWHGYPPSAPVSLAEWHYAAANGMFAARLRAGGAAIALPMTAEHRAKVSTFWDAHADVTNQICTRLQIPCEVVVALACTESLANLSERSVRLEHLKTRNRTDLRASAAAAHELEYDQVVGTQAMVTAATYNASETTRLDVTFANARRLAANRLTQFDLLVGDADRLDITANNASAAAITDYQITVKDVRFDGGSQAADTQTGGLTRFYSASMRAGGTATEAQVRTAVARAGRLRRLSLRLGTHTLAGTTTATVVHNGAATALAVTLAAGAVAGANDLQSIDVASGDTISLQVTTAAGAGQIGRIECRLQFAPPAAGTVYVLEGYSPPAPGVPDPWDGAALLRVGRTLTWGQLEGVLDGIAGNRVSPGIIQTLISTAISIRRYLDQLDSTVYDDLGFLPLPDAPHEYLNDWLLTAGHSLLLGAAYLRQLYHTADTRFDLPVIGAGYNRGNVLTTANVRWGFGSPSEQWKYPDDAAPYFNAAVEFFDGTNAPAVAPTVRFMS